MAAGHRPRRALLLGPLVVARQAQAARREDREAALERLRDGTAAFRRGDVVTATRHWTEAIRLGRLARDPSLEAEALARRGEAYRLEGQFRDAEQDLAAALAKAREAGDGFLVAAAAGALGNLALLSRRTARAEPLLLESQAGALRLGDAALAGASANDLGNLYAATRRPEQAGAVLRRRGAACRDGQHAALAATAEVNAARLALEVGDADRAAGLLRGATARLVAMPPGYPVGLALVATGTAAGGGARRPTPPLVATGRQAYEAAGAIGESLGNPTLASLSAGGLGRVQEQAGRLDDAARLTRQALFSAQQIPAPDLTFRWEWQQARIDRARGRDDAALAGYRRAVAALQEVRQDIPIEYRDGRSSFQSTFGPLYLDYADLLLRRAAAGRGGARAAPLLREARAALEGLRESELQDYFRDSCIAEFEARQRGVETVSPDTAVIYPVVIPDRMELLVSVGEDIRQVVVPVAEPRLRAEADRFRLLLERRTTNEFLEPARRLHELILRPVEAMLAGRGVATLVVVPDGVLRTIPFAALHDGTSFLVERHAVATAPGLRLVDPRPLTPDLRRTIALGLSQGRHGFPPLPHVVAELDGIRQLERRGTTLLDAAFLRQRFAREMRDGNWSVVHIASHGEFGSDPSRSFVLAYDGELSLDDLEGSIKLSRFRDVGLELLVLSACQTAAGDDRAALGLAGLALKAGARSALATLWFVSDEASGLLAVEFHRQLRDGMLTKARALQEAQRGMIADPLLGHPAYWAPFLLIGNWL